MKNKEKFAKEIVEIAITGDAFGLNKCNNSLTACSFLRCLDCAFMGDDTGNCDIHTEQWAEAEYVESKVFTEEEKAVIRP